MIGPNVAHAHLKSTWQSELEHSRHQTKPKRIAKEDGEASCDGETMRRRILRKLMVVRTPTQWQRRLPVKKWPRFEKLGYLHETKRRRAQVCNHVSTISLSSGQISLSFFLLVWLFHFFPAILETDSWLFILFATSNIPKLCSKHKNSMKKRLLASEC